MRKLMSVHEHLWALRSSLEYGDIVDPKIFHHSKCFRLEFVILTLFRKTSPALMRLMDLLFIFSCDEQLKK